MIKRKAFTATTTLFLSGLLVAPAISQDKPTLEQVRQSWKSREEKAKTLIVELNSERTIPKDSSRLLLRGINPRIADGPEPNPPRDYLVKGSGRVCLDGGRMRYSLKCPAWDADIKALVEDKEEIETFDGKLAKSFRIPGSRVESNPAGYPFATIQDADKPSSGMKLCIAPLVWTFRGLNPQFANIDEFIPTGKTKIISGNSCIELGIQSTDGKTPYLIYLDTSKEYVLARRVWLDGDTGRTLTQIDVTYRPEPSVGWVPDSWEYTWRLRSGELTEAERWVASTYRIGIAIANSEFDIEFPPKTLVDDHSFNKNVGYVIQNDNKKGVELPLQKEPTYAELDRPQQNNRRTTLLLVGSVFVGLLLLWIVLRARRPLDEKRST